MYRSNELEFGAAMAVPIGHFSRYFIFRAYTRKLNCIIHIFVFYINDSRTISDDQCEGGMEGGG